MQNWPHSCTNSPFYAILLIGIKFATVLQMAINKICHGCLVLGLCANCGELTPSSAFSFLHLLWTFPVGRRHRCVVHHGGWWPLVGIISITGNCHSNLRCNFHLSDLLSSVTDYSLTEDCFLGIPSWNLPHK